MTTPRTLTVGDCVGSYRLLGKLGEGGMGLVFIAEHDTIGKRVAVKVLLPQYSQSQEFVRRFFNEARAVTQIRHPALIDVYDFGQHERTGCAYIVMELLEGESLATCLARVRRLDEALLIEVAGQIAGALAAVHAKGIIHRDLKPDNVFLVSDPSTPSRLRVKVLDFGIAKLADGGVSSARTRTGALLGTPAYMAPEQCRGLANLDHRADVYSLGCILYEMAAATQPFVGEGMGDVLAAHIYEQPRPVRELAPQLSPQLASIIARAMAKNVAQRYASMAALAADLEAVRLGVGQLAGTVVAAETEGGRRATQSRTTLSGSAAEVVSRPARRRAARVSLFATVAVGAALGALALTRLPHRQAQSNAAAVAATAAAATAAAATTAAATTAAATAAAATTAVATPPSHAGGDRADEPTAPTPAAATPSPTVTIRIDSIPSGAELVRRADGERLGVTPWKTTMPRGSARLAYVLKAPGFHHEDVDVDSSDDRQLTIRLKPTRRPPPARAPTAKPPEFEAP